MTALQTIAEHLTRRRQTVTCAESCTGGLLVGAFTSIAGSSQWFHQSFVTYSNQAKEERLGVMPDTLLQHGAVSRETVYEMARGAKAVAQADYAPQHFRHRGSGRRQRGETCRHGLVRFVHADRNYEIGRASCRERV